jgi:glucokinase
MFLVADVGGTNTRIALAHADGHIAAGPERFRNAEFPDFLSVAEAYRDSARLPALTGASVAIAGPVSGATASLTNRDWHFDSARIGAVLGTPRVVLLNDIVALGHAMGSLGPDQAQVLRPGTPLSGGQRLVLGMGTGTNGCVVVPMGAQVAVLEAELGHGTPPLDVSAALHAALGDGAAAFDSTEEVFSGRGLERLHRARTGQAQAAQAIVAAAAEDAAGPAAGTLDLMADLSGHLLRQLYFFYMPAGGAYFAGSVARAVLSGPRVARFEATLCRDGLFADELRAIPVSLITDDAAALAGCAQVLRAGG